MARINQFGFDDHIPLPIQRAVRQQCGFGCIVCGAAICNYHHFDPPFSKAKKHDPVCIVLLCPSCHNKTEHGLISPEIFKHYVAHPKCLEVGFSRENILFGQHMPTIFFGNTLFASTPSIIKIFGFSLFHIEIDESAPLPVQLTARFHDKTGRLVAQITRNEWKAYTNSWDVEIVSKRFAIRHAKRDFSLQMELELPNAIRITRLNLLYRGWRFEINSSEQFSGYFPDGRKWFTMNSAVIAGCQNGIVVT